MNTKNIFFKNFIICGLIGWGMECFLTGMSSIFRKKDRKLSCHTSIWMFLIYGLAACFYPICKKLCNKNILCRGGIYIILIFIIEYITGITLKKFDACPWDYSKAKLNYKGVIRLDYAPAWFIAGLFFEKVINDANNI